MYGYDSKKFVWPTDEILRVISLLVCLGAQVECFCVSVINFAFAGIDCEV